MANLQRLSELLAQSQVLFNAINEEQRVSASGASANVNENGPPILPPNRLSTDLSSVQQQTSLPIGQMFPSRPVLSVSDQRQGAGPSTLGQMFSPRSIASATVTGASGNIHREIRESFSPYSSTQFSRNRRGSDRRRNSDDRLGRPMSLVNLSLICLDSYDTTQVPDELALTELQSNGFGSTFITIDRNATASDLKTRIYEDFPRLCGAEIEVLLPIGRSKNAPLVRVSKSQPVVAPLVLAQNRRLFYVRPMNQDNTSASTDPPGRLTTSEITSVARPAALATAAALGGFSFRPTPQTEILSRSSACASDTSSSLMQTVAEFKNVESYREYLHASNQGQQLITIKRDNFLHGLLGHYKNPNFNFLKETQVEFEGEEGCDAAGLSREFFTCGMMAFRNEKIMGMPFFEGQEDHLIPSSNLSFITTDVYRSFGKFIAHAAVQGGIGFVGLSPAVVSYLFKTDEEPVVVTLDDIPDYDDRATLLKMENVDSASENDRKQIKGLMQSAGIYVDPFLQNKWCVQAYMQWRVILSKESIFKEIIRGMKDTSLFDFIQQHSDLQTSFFPSDADLTYLPDFVASTISYTGTHNFGLRCALNTWIRSLKKEDVRNLVSCWTGSPRLPYDGLVVHFAEDGRFVFNTCHNTLTIPSTYSDKALTDHMEMALAYGVYGFGCI